jgi:formylglycine-generating enzyme required for sulfatase activity
LTRTIRIRDARGERRYRAADFPLVVGGPGAGDVELPDAAPGERIALLGLVGGALCWQPEQGAGHAAGVDGSVRWLAPGDVIIVGSARLRCEPASDGLALTVAPAPAGATLPPDPRAEALEPPATEAGDDVAPAVYRPGAPVAPRRRRAPLLWSLAGAAALLLFGGAVAFLVTAKAVRLDVEPAPDSLEIEGGFSLALGGNHLLRPGRYTVVAAKAGYETARLPIDVTEAERQQFSIALVKLPGRLSVRTDAPNAEVFIDGARAGDAPLLSFEVAPGEHEVEVRAPRHLPHARRVTIEGGGVEQSLDARLEPAWADVTIESVPAGAEVRLGDEVLGTTPLTAQIERGQRELELKLEGYKIARVPVTVEAGVAQKLAPVTLVKADGLVEVRSTPSGAAVTVDGRFRGATPLELELAPGRSYKVTLAKAGYAPVTRTVEPVSGEDMRLVVTLEGMLGDVRITSNPADAELYVDGEHKGRTPQKLALTAVEHRIEVRKEGYAPATQTVLPRPGFEQQVVIQMQTAEVARRAALSPRITTKLGQQLVLIEPPGQFQMGASRREPGRRANETLYEVSLQRAFYIGVKEVTNKEYRSFQASHNSGTRDSFSLDGDAQPVVRISWADAARYCNWLSEQEGLPPAYEERNGRWFAVSPMTTGYRLPSEAEWTWVARYSGGEPIRFPWGNDMPPTEKSGNYADVTARSTVGPVIEGYDDGFPATAPVGSFPANSLGIYDLGGNVAEWMHDFYTIEVSSGFEVLTDPLGPPVGELHVIRGSSYLHGELATLRLTYRDNGNDGRDDVGFRIARYAE